MSSDDESKLQFRFADLPEDIARSIFEYAISDEEPNLSCSLVSKTVRAWVEPILYHELNLKHYGAIEDFYRTIQHHPSRHASFIATHVKRLFMNSCPSWDIVLAIISACPNVEHLQFHLRLNYYEGKHLRIGEHSAWNNLSGPTLLYIPACFFLPSQRHFRHTALFRNIARLDIYWNEGVENWEFDALADLHTLSHLSVTAPPESAETNIVRAECAVSSAIPFFPPSLKVCIHGIPFAQWHSEALPRIIPRIGALDVRVVVAVEWWYWEKVCNEEWIHLWATWRVYESHSVDYVTGLWERAEARAMEKRSRIMGGPEEKADARRD